MYATKQHDTSKLESAVNILLGIATLCLFIRALFFFYPTLLIDTGFDPVKTGHDFIGLIHTSLIITASFFTFYLMAGLSSLIKIYQLISLQNEIRKQALFFLLVLFMVSAFVVMDHFFAFTLLD